MQRTRILGLCVIAAFAVAAAVSDVASAELPEYVVCAKAPEVGGVSTGKYDDKACSQINAGGTGGFELTKGLGKKTTFSSEGGASRLQASEVPEELTCKASKSTGELTGTKEERNIIVTLTGCEAGGLQCTSAGAATGTIVTNPLHGLLGYLAGKGTANPTVGVLLVQEETTYSAIFECEGVQMRARGPLIAEITGDINAISTESTYTFRETGGIPQYTSFEGGTFLENEWLWEFNRGSGYEPEGGMPAGLELSANVTGEALEIRA